MTPVKRGPHMEDRPGMGELAQTPDDQVAYGGWTPTQSLNLGPAISVDDINNGKIECTLPPAATFARGIGFAPDGQALELGEPTLQAHEAIRLGSDHYLIPATELAALRADRERVEWMAARCVRTERQGVRNPIWYVMGPFAGILGKGSTWREAVDDARGAK